MATEPKNPFASLAANLNGSRLGMAEAERNFSRVMSREQFRASTRDRATMPTGAASAAGPIPSLTQLSSAAALPKEVPVDSPPKASAFSRLSRNRSMNLTTLPSTAQTIEPSVESVGLSKASTVSAFDESDLVMGDAAATPRPASYGNMVRSPAAAIVVPRKKVIYTAQQNAVIECEDRLIVVDAFAGCAKTTTAIGYAAHRPNNRMLYLCLNSANAEEAKARFGPNVTCATTHSVAWGAVKPNKLRVTKSWRPMLVQEQLRTNDSRMASYTIRVLASFFNSADTEISEKHALDVQEERDLKPADVMSAVSLACVAWRRMNDPSDTFQMPHDAYLKMFALKAPQLLQYDTIIFDEAQDANPVTMQIIAGQRHVKLLCIGDRHQSIYAFRGSVNAMEKFSTGATRFHLSQTFRFGPKIAEVANTILSEFKGEKVPIIGMGKDGGWNPQNSTTLSRTNAELFRIAAPRRGEGVHWVGGKMDKFTNEWVDGCHSYRLDGVMDAYHLFSRDRTLIKDPIMRAKFTTWDDYVKYGDDCNDSEAKIVVKVVEEFAHDIPELVEAIIKNAVRDSKDAEVTLTTVHRSKGLEWDCVQISNDFEVLEEAEAKLAQHAGAKISEQDINLLYVGVTRAAASLRLNAETIEWLKKLPQHKAAREAAVARQLADTEKVRAQLRGQMAVDAAS